MTSFESVAALNTFLASRSYVQGFSFSPADVAVLSSLSGIPEKAAYPHAYRWAIHIIALAGADNVSFGGAVSAAKGAAAPAAKAAEAEVEDMFINDGETEEERAANKARHERMARARKPKPVEKSLIVLDVMPWEADCDLEAVWKQIITKEQEGLTWGATFKMEPVAFGIKKLVMTCTIVDALVLL